MGDWKSRVSAMSLEEKVGQVFIFTWRNRQQAINDLRFHPGGYIRIYSDALTVARETAEIQALSPHPLIMAADFERGIGGTVSGALEVITCMGLGATGDEQAAFDAGYMIGAESAAMGINMNYAPVLDVNNNPKNPVINTRSFGQDPEMVARLGVAFMKGLQKANLITCGKHFPGHGNTGFDTHAGLGTVEGTREQLDSLELLPFRHAIANGVDAIMSAHLHAAALEPERMPATLSHRVLTQLLRGEMGFKGVIVSDALDMGAIAAEFTPENSIPAAINAGCDQLIMPEDSAQAWDILYHAVKRGTVSEDRLNESVARILAMKSGRVNLPDPAALPALVSVPAHLERSLEIARAAVTLAKPHAAIPLKPEGRYCCVLFHNGLDGRAPFLEPLSFADYLAAGGRNVSRHVLANSAGYFESDNTTLQRDADQCDAIILAGWVKIHLSSGTLDLGSDLLEKLEGLRRFGKPVILVSFGSPYVINQLPWVDAYICGYGGTQPMQQAVAEALVGATEFTGNLPITLS